MKELIKNFRDFTTELERLNYIYFILSFDEETDCPKKDKMHSLDVQEFIYKQSMDIVMSDEYKNTVEKLYMNRDKLDDVTKLEIENEYEDMDKLNKIPKDEVFKHVENTNRCGFEWQAARESLDYSKFLNELEELVEYNKKYIKWQETDTIKGYDVLLDDMEKGYNEKLYDEFFDCIEENLVPYVKKVLQQKPKYNTKLDTLTFSIDKQKILTKLIADKMEYTDEVGCIRETAHPFTNWANHNDVRITTSYDEKLLFSNLYSVMHEIGHALFQLQMDSKYDGTNIFSKVTCITHESQSRFYENYLGKSRGFVEYLYPILIDLYPLEFEGITVDDLYYYVNNVQAQYTRTEADELTYPLHVLIRYKIEKSLFNGEINVNQMEDMFNSLMDEYLGIKPHNMKEGVFQDVHWSSGFGYFPTYAVGSAYGAQFLDAMNKSIDVESAMRLGDFKTVNKWLKENIHQFSSTRRNLEVVRNVCQEEFDPLKYIDYLKKKFDKIYF